MTFQQKVMLFLFAVLVNAHVLKRHDATIVWHGEWQRLFSGAADWIQHIFVYLIYYVLLEFELQRSEHNLFVYLKGK